MPVSNAGHPWCYRFSEPLADHEIDSAAADPGAQMLLTSEPASHDTWRRINRRLLSRRPDVEIRVFGSHGNTCDLAFLPLLSNLRRLTVGGAVARPEFIAELSSSLESLSISMSELTDFDFLESVTPALRSLSLFPTKSKRPSLLPLARFRHLETLYLERQQKDIDVLSGLTELRDLTLRSISTANLDYLRPLRNIWSLDLKLGGIRDLSAIAGIESIAYLEAWQVRGLSDLGAVSELPGLENLFLQSLANVASLPSLRGLAKLRRVVLVHMTGLHDFASLEFAPALEEFALVEAMGNQPPELAPVLRNPALRRAQAGFGSLKRNAVFERMCDAAGIEAFHHSSPFQYGGPGA